MSKIVLLKHKGLNIIPISDSTAILHSGELLYDILELIKASFAVNRNNYFNPVVFLPGSIEKSQGLAIVNLQSGWTKEEVGSDVIYIKNN